MIFTVSRGVFFLKAYVSLPKSATGS